MIRREDEPFSVVYSVAAYTCCKTGGFLERGLAEVHCVGIARLTVVHDAYSGAVEHGLLRLADLAVLQLDAGDGSVLGVDIGILPSAREGSRQDGMEGEFKVQSLKCIVPIVPIVPIVTIVWLPYFMMASARASRAGRSASFIRLRMVTVGSTISISFMLSSIERITFPAVGAQLPFSSMPTRRFW